MEPVNPSCVPKAPRWVGFLVLAAAGTIALASARPYAGGWNDGSRLATVEVLVDHHTLAIDESIFVEVPPPQEDSPAPYPPDDLYRRGTADKLFIQGHYYSDKSPVPALLMAGVYQAWQWGTGLTASERADDFCYLMTVVSSGLAYVVAVGCCYWMGRNLGLPVLLNLALTGSLALGTVALTYTRHVNNHILLLGITAALTLGITALASANEKKNIPWLLLGGLGFLAGLGYSVDLGAGPVLFFFTLVLVVFHCRRVKPVGIFILAAVPWLALHHAVNYAVGGTWKPANAVPEYFLWPGCPFNPENMTGAWNHSGIGRFLVYAGALLVGKHGFLGHNLPLFMALSAMVVLLWGRTTPHRPEIVWAGCCCGGVWLIYALTSTNYSGQCCSIRWFVPLLAPAYLALAIFLRAFPRYRGDFLILGAWGVLLGGLAWLEGPWMQRMVPFFWPIQGAALVSWIWFRFRQRRTGGFQASRQGGEEALLSRAA